MPDRLPWGAHRLYATLVAPRLVPDYLELLQLPPDAASVLDVGCGPGELLSALARRRPRTRFEGVDMDAAQVRLARRRERRNLRVRRARGKRMPYARGTFDTVLATESLHHWRDTEATLEEIHRVLKPGGRLWVLEGRGQESWREVHERLGLPRLALVQPLLRIVYRRTGYEEADITTEVRPVFRRSPFGGCRAEGCGRWWRITADKAV